MSFNAHKQTNQTVRKATPAEHPSLNAARTSTNVVVPESVSLRARIGQQESTTPLLPRTLQWWRKLQQAEFKGGRPKVVGLEWDKDVLLHCWALPHNHHGLTDWCKHRGPW